MQEQQSTNDAPPFISHLRLRRTPTVGALAPLLETGTGNAERGHHLIWSLFADHADRRRDFLWYASGPSEFIVLSARRPHDQHQLFEIHESRPFEPELKPGDRVRFLLHANPVVSEVRERAPRRMCKHDIITNVLRKHPENERHRLFETTVRSRGFSWLQTQGQAKGFAVREEEVRIHGYRRQRIQRRRKRNATAANNPRYATLDFEGLLTVTEPATLLRAIATGFGSSRTWGCGLMRIETAPETGQSASR